MDIFWEMVGEHSASLQAQSGHSQYRHEGQQRALWRSHPGGNGGVRAGPPELGRRQREEKGVGLRQGASDRRGVLSVEGR